MSLANCEGIARQGELDLTVDIRVEAGRIACCTASRALHCSLSDRGGIVTVSHGSEGDEAASIGSSISAIARKASPAPGTTRRSRSRREG